jgi:hypothetical protein
LAGLLADEYFSTKFSTDIRKFSRNFELSTFYDDMNLGKVDYYCMHACIWSSG